LIAFAGSLYGPILPMLDDRPSGIVPPGKMALDAAYGIRLGTSVDNGEVWGALSSAARGDCPSSWDLSSIVDVCVTHGFAGWLGVKT